MDQAEYAAEEKPANVGRQALALAAQPGNTMIAAQVEGSQSVAIGADIHDEVHNHAALAPTPPLWVKVPPASTAPLLGRDDLLPNLVTRLGFAIHRQVPTVVAFMPNGCEMNEPHSTLPASTMNFWWKGFPRPETASSLSLPAYARAVASALSAAAKRLPRSVTIILDVDAEVCRLGYGNIERAGPDPSNGCPRRGFGAAPAWRAHWPAHRRRGHHCFQPPGAAAD